MRTLLLIGCFLASPALASCGGDDVLEAVRAHPLASPTFSFGEVVTQTARTGDTSTGLSRPRLDTRAFTTIEVPPGRVGEAFEELRRQAEALGYEFQMVSEHPNRLRAREIATFPDTFVLLSHTEKTVKLEVVGIRND